jgi:hypothetical protein
VLNKELTARNCTDYLVLYDNHAYTKTVRIKLFKSKEDKLEYLIKKEEFIKYAQKNIRIGMSYDKDEIDSLIKISSFGFKRKNSLLTNMKVGQGENYTYTMNIREYTIDYFLYLKLVNGILEEWKIIQ